MKKCIEDIIQKTKLNIKNDFKNKTMYYELFKNKENIENLYNKLFMNDTIDAKEEYESKLNMDKSEKMKKEKEKKEKKDILSVNIDELNLESRELLDIGLEQDIDVSNFNTIETELEYDADFGLMEDFVLENVDLSYTPAGSELSKDILLKMLTVDKNIDIDIDQDIIEDEHSMGILEEEIIEEHGYYLSQTQLKVLGNTFEVNPEDISIYKPKIRKKLQTSYIFDFFNRLPNISFYVIYNSLYVAKTGWFGIF